MFTQSRLSVQIETVRKYMTSENTCRLLHNQQVRVKIDHQQKKIEESFQKLLC